MSPPDKAAPSKGEPGFRAIRKLSARLLSTVRRGDALELSAMLSAGALPGGHGEEARLCPPICAAAEAPNPALLRLLLASGADPSAASSMGDTPLILAARRGHLEHCEALLASGAQVNERSGDAESPLLGASEMASVALMGLLIKAGADLGAKDAFGRNALLRAAGSGRSTRSEALKLLLAEGLCANSQDHKGNRALHYAVDDPRAVELLLEAGAEPNALGQSGNSALREALSWCYSTSSTDSRWQSAALLAQAGADVWGAMAQIGGLEEARSRWGQNGLDELSRWAASFEARQLSAQAQGPVARKPGSRL